MEHLFVKGKIISGKGEGAKFIKLPWVTRQLTEKLGFIPYSGTLNIKLSEESLVLKKFLKSKGTEILPATGFCRGSFFEAYLKDNLKCAVVVPEVANYPEDVIEIIAPVNLRKKLQLKDGDDVEIKILL
jgi:riboflavin kinase